MPSIARIFRHGLTYAIVERGNSLGYICIDGKEEHITRRYNVDTALDCMRMLEKITGKGGWKWVA